MRKPPCLQNGTIVYTRLKALTWSANGLVFPDQLQADAGATLNQLVVDESPTKSLVVNCIGVNTIDDHALQTVVRSLAASPRHLVFVNANEQFRDDLARAMPSVANKSSFDSEDVVSIGSASFTIVNAGQYVDHCKQIENDHVANLVAKSFANHTDGMKRLSSTPLLANGVFNAQSLISQSDSFTWLCLAMTDKVEMILQAERPLRPRLLAVSLRASPFAAAIAFLLQGRPAGVEIVDHMGPKCQVLEEHLVNRSESDLNYIYVGDFVVGGTELQIAQNYAQFRGCTLFNAVVIGSFLDAKDYSTSVKIHPLTALTTVRPDAKFQFVSDES